MAGASFKVEIEDSQARAMFARLLRAGVNMKPLFTEIGSALEDSTKQRMRAEEGPDGEPWVDLKPSTWARKKTDRKLYESGDLFDSVRFEAGSAFVEIIVGPTEYAASMHFGRPEAGIPERPIVGISEADSGEVDDALSAYLDAAIG
jgi:phage virion morphogenesis protein